MLDSLTDTPAFRRDPPAIPPESAPVPRERAAPHVWQIECTGWWPARFPGAMLGHCRLVLPGGLALLGVRLVHMPAGIRVVFPHQYRPDKTDADPQANCAWFGSGRDWVAFSIAAAAAVEAFRPGALTQPHAAPDAARADCRTETTAPPCAALAPVLTPSD
jgi:hypothetical protein